MAKNDPFGFDMSVGADKKRRTRGRRGMSGAFETSTRNCEHPGCTEAGQYRAPRSPDILDDYFWFCRDHVREYNLKWNFFSGSTEEEFQAQIDKDRVWDRPTKPFAKPGEEARAWSRLGIQDAHEVLGEKGHAEPRQARSPEPASCRPPNARRSSFWRPETTGPEPRFASNTRVSSRIFIPT